MYLGHIFLKQTQEVSVHPNIVSALTPIHTNMHEQI